jgi:hypothetical protein
MAIWIEEVLSPSTEEQCGVTKRWLPARPVQLFEHRLKDAWRVLMGKATAVQWPDQRK